MNSRKTKLHIEQLDRKMTAFGRLADSEPSSGWIRAVRETLGMSLEQLGKKMGISAQSVRELEQREAAGTASLKSLNEAARALGLRLAYGVFAPGSSLAKIIHNRARQVAEELVLRTHRTMSLEDQANSRARIKRAIKERADELISKKIKNLWD